MKRLSEIAAKKGAALTFREGGEHSVVLFDGVKVTTVPRHREINEHTARGIVRAAEAWVREG